MAGEKVLGFQIKVEDKQLEGLKRELIATAADIKKLQEATKGNAGAQKASAKTAVELELKQKELRAAYAAQTREILKTRAANISASGSYDQLTRQTNLLRAQLNALPGGFEKTNLTAQKLKEQIAKNTEQLKKFDSAIGDNRRNVGNYASAFQGIGTSFVKIGAIIGGTIAVFRSFSSLLSSSIQAFGESERAQKSLETALGRTSEALTRQAAALQEVTRFEDDAITQGQASLAQLGLTERQIFELTPAVLDFAEATQVDLGTAFKQIGGAVEGTGGKLGKYDVKVKDTNTSSKNLSIVMAALTEHFKGQAVAAGDTASGAIDKLRVRVDNLREKMGEELLPVQEAILKAQGNWFRILGTILPVLIKAAPAILALAGAIAAYRIAVTLAATATAVFGKALNAVPFVKIITVVGSVLAGAFGLFASSTNKAKKEVDEMNTSLEGLISVSPKVEEAIKNLRHQTDLINLSQNELQEGVEALEAKLTKYGKTLEDTEIKTKSFIERQDELIESFVRKPDEGIFLSEKTEAVIFEDIIKKKLALLNQELEARKKKAKAEIKINEELIQKVQRQLAVQLAIIKRGEEARRTAADQEGVDFENRIKEAGLFGIKRQDLTETQLAALLQLEEEHADNITRIFKETQKELTDSTAGVTGGGFAPGEPTFLEMLFGTSDPQRIQEIKNAAIDIAESISDATFQIVRQNQDRQTQLQLESLERRREIELSNQNLTTEQKLVIDNNFEKRKLDIQREAFKRNQRIAIAEALINGAVAITKMLAELGPASPPAIIASGVATAAQVAVIGAQKFKKGGVIGGKSHEEGGTTFVGSDGSVFEAEKGELLAVVNKRSTEILAGLSNLNVAGGGVPFMRSGGIVPTFQGGGFPSITTQNIDTDALANSTARILRGTLRDIRVVNVATETAAQNNKVLNLQSKVTF